MNLFHKTTHEAEESAPQPEIQPEEQHINDDVNQSVAYEKAAPQVEKTTEELAREWWSNRFGETMPDEVVKWMKQLTRAEARRLHVATALLTPQKQTRLQEARQLAETKIRNIEASLQRLHDQQEWQHRFVEKKHELTEHKSRLYEANKRLATVSNEERELLRFEQFETVQGLFQRMLLWEGLSRQHKQMMSALTHELEDAERDVTELRKKMAQLNDANEDTTKQMTQVRDQLEEANRIIGARVVLDLDELTANQLSDICIQQKGVLTQEIAEHEKETERLQESLTQLNTQRQAMEPHQRLVAHGEMILTLLDRLREIGSELETLDRQQREELRRQQEENDMLSRVFSEYQGVETDIKALQAETHLHRQQNLGRSSYALQERAMQLKSRREMLISAQSLWNRIQSGFMLIEEKTQLVNRIRLNLDTLKRNLVELENKVVPMRQLCHEKEYTLTLSKSQNVIQLRGDLQEGVSCTVCGATHHPYHSDTMLEQSLLINDLRTDYEILKSELATKEAQLLQLRLDYAAESARHAVEEEALSQLRHRQMEDVKEWSVFAPLDRSFKECSSSTNLTARAALLRQLIENTAYDADDAQKELDEYNYHQVRINELTEELNRKEQHKNDLTMRLNEVNTGCQVLARQVEQRRQMRSKQQEAYTQLYERLNSLITLNDWYNNWKNNHEGLRLQIGQMMDTWAKLDEKIQETRHRREVEESLLTFKQSVCTFIDSLVLQIRDEREKRRTLRKEGDKNYESVMGQEDVKGRFDTYYQQLLAIEEEVKQCNEQTRNAVAKYSELMGRQSELQGQERTVDANAISERSALDIWMRKFNASHPPVQYAELEQAFALNKDWNETRDRVRSTRIEAMLEQTRVDSLQSAIVALQAEGMRPSSDDDAEVMESLVAQQKQLEKQRQDVLMQLAENHIALNKHEECKAQLQAEEETMYKVLNS